MEEARFGATKSGDPNTRFGKNFIFRTHPNPMHKDLDRPEIFQVYLDERAVEGGMYFSGGMVVEPPKTSPTEKPHYHDYMEYIILLSTDPTDQNNLGGEFFNYIEDEKHTYDQACVIVVPPSSALLLTCRKATSCGQEDPQGSSWLGGGNGTGGTK